MPATLRRKKRELSTINVHARIFRAMGISLQAIIRQPEKYSDLKIAS
jgi:hypothetical protein